jgi:7-keto-8-aminopelargonate synthetase-like enzyme
MLRDKTAALKESKSTVTLEIIDEFFSADNANTVIGEAHATGLYVPDGRGMVDCVPARLPTFGKAPARSGLYIPDMCNSYYQCYYHRLPTSFDRLEDSTVERV